MSAIQAPPFRIQEEDGSPIGFPHTLKVPNGTLTDNGDGTFSFSGTGANTALSNLASVAINTSLVSDTDNTDALGSAAIGWSDLWLGSGGIITFSTAPSTADITITHSANVLSFAGSTAAAGSFGFGDTAPDVRVSIAGTDGASSTMRLQRSQGNAANPIFRFQKSRGTVLSPTVITTGDVLGSFDFRGHDGTQFVTGSSISATSTGTIATNSIPTNLTFSTVVDGGTSNTERMRITNAGRVGIGTTAPDKVVEINSADGNNLRLTYNDSNGSATNYVDLLTTSAGDLTITPSGGSVSMGTTTDLTLGTIELGHASDTTIARSGAGDITIEGNAVYRAGGTDVPVTDGGTGASTAATARTNLGLGEFTTTTAGNLPILGPETAGTIAVNGFGAGTSITTVNSTTYTINMANSVKVFSLAAGNGDGVLCVTNYLTTTVTFLGTNGGTFVNSSSPGSGQLGIYKSANSHDVSFKTGSAADGSFGSWTLTVLGTNIS